MLDLQKQDNIFVLRMARGENRFHPEFLTALEQALEQVEQSVLQDPPCAALVTVGEGKFYSNGLDLDWLAGPGRGELAPYLERIHALLARLPEIDIQIPFSPPMAALIQARMSKLAAHEAMMTGRRYTAEQALQRQIVHELGAEHEVLPKALALAKAHGGKHGPTLRAIKQGAYRELLAAFAQH